MVSGRDLEPSLLTPKAGQAVLHIAGGLVPGVPGFTHFCVYAWTPGTEPSYISYLYCTSWFAITDKNQN